VHFIFLRLFFTNYELHEKQIPFSESHIKLTSIGGFTSNSDVALCGAADEEYGTEGGNVTLTALTAGFVRK